MEGIAQNTKNLSLEQHMGGDLLAAPVSKLDADQYSADDLDGVTEGLFGSGSISYASLRSAETGAMMAENLAAEESRQSQDESIAGQNIGTTRFNTDTETPVQQSEVQSANITDTDRAVDPMDTMRDLGEFRAGEGGLAGATVGAVGASQLSTGSGAFAAAGAGQDNGGEVNDGGGSTGGTGGGEVTVSTTTLPGLPGIQGTSGENGTAGANGSNGQDTSGSGDIINIVNTMVNNLLGDTVTTVTDTVNNLLGDTVTDVTDTVNNLLGDVGGLLSGGGEGSGDSDLVVHVGVDAVDSGIADVTESVNLDPLENVVGDIDVNIGAGASLLDSGEVNATPVLEGDMHALGIDTSTDDIISDIQLDPAAGIAGDIELGNVLDSIGGTGSNSALDADGWTESSIGNGEGLFSDVAGGADGGGDVLPDPVGTVAEGLGALHVDHVGGGGGGGHVGSLFG